MPQLSIVKARATAASARTVNVRIDDETAFAVTYNVEKYSIADLDALKGDADTGTFATYLAGIVTDWDLMDGDDKAPITRETLESLPLAVLRRIAEAVNDDLVPSKS